MPILSLDVFDQHCAIVGRTGSGKSWAARTVVERWLDLRRRVCIIDPTGVWYGLRSSADGKKPGYPVAVFGGDHADVPIGEPSGARLAEIIADRNLPAVIDTSEMTLHQRHQFMTEFLETLYRKNRGSIHLVIDEADEISPQNPLPETRRMLGATDRVVRRGRARGFRVMMLTQRPAVLHKNVLAQASTLVAMRLPAPQDRKAVEDWIRGQADVRQAGKMLQTLAGLPRGEGWVWAPDRGILRRHKFGAIATFDSMRAPEHGERVAEPTTLAAVELGELRALLAGTEEPAAVGQRPAQPITLHLLAETEQKGYRRGREALAREWLEQFQEIRTEHAAAMHSLGDILNRFLQRLEAAMLINRAGKLAVTPNVAAGYVVTAADRAAADIIERKKDLPKPTQATATDLPPAAVKILDVLRRGLPLTWAQTATLAGLKARGGYFNSGRKALRDHALVLEADNVVRLSQKAAELFELGQPVEDEEALLAWWLAALPSAPARLLRAIMTSPEGLSKQELGRHLDLATTGGYWNSALAVLRNNELIAITGDKISLRRLIS